MSDLHEIAAMRPAPRTTSLLVLMIMCAVAFGGVSLLHENASDLRCSRIASMAAAAQHHSAPSIDAKQSAVPVAAIE